MRPRIRAIVLIAALVSVPSLAACTGDEQGQRPTPAPVTPKPLADGPAELRGFYGQQVRWGPCDGYASTDLGERVLRVANGLQCTRLKVPLDYDEPDGPTVDVALLRQPARGPGKRIGSLLVNPGGPGASGVEAAAALTLSPAMKELAARFDIVGFDPRGVGASRPQVKCYTPAERDADRADDVEVAGTKAAAAAAERQARAFARKCAQRTKYGKQFLQTLGSKDVARDMDVMRSALGDAKLTYLGYSYGTRIGYTYAEQFPDKVRAMVLDGALDPTQDVVDSLVKQGAGFGRAFTEFARWCVERPDCALGRSAPHAVRAYQKLVRPLIDHKIDLADGRKLSFEDATTGTIYALYTESRWEDLNAALNELKRNRGEQLIALADEYLDREDDGTYANTQDVLVAVRCVDDRRETDRAKRAEAERRYLKVAPFLDPGRPSVTYRDVCAFWPVEPTAKPHLPDVEGLPPVLVISTTGDPATPYQAGVQLAKALGGRLLTFEGRQHTVFGQGVRCVDDAGVAYLIEGELPPQGLRCKNG
ncbi:MULTISPECIES: alpha/beta hydrolase [Thermocrispum]|uniref:Alpha/beta hydrolase n=1 Tax=Thermocrispum agreste TaxID=37925 RepID=A0ABD6FI91_9PSEU|nr:MULTISPECIES: alpha/beta hydrolase [Thermocrispum]